MYYIALGLHKKTVRYCIADFGGKVHEQGKIGARNRVNGGERTIRPATLSQVADSNHWDSPAAEQPNQRGEYDATSK
jgi:hypothetical protein